MNQIYIKTFIFITILLGCSIPTNSAVKVNLIYKSDIPIPNQIVTFGENETGLGLLIFESQNEGSIVEGELIAYFITEHTIYTWELFKGYNNQFYYRVFSDSYGLRAYITFATPSTQGGGYYYFDFDNDPLLLNIIDSEQYIPPFQIINGEKYSMIYLEEINSIFNMTQKIIYQPIMNEIIAMDSSTNIIYFHDTTQVNAMQIQENSTGIYFLKNQFDYLANIYENQIESISLNLQNNEFIGQIVNNNLTHQYAHIRNTQNSAILSIQSIQDPTSMISDLVTGGGGRNVNLINENILIHLSVIPEEESSKVTLMIYSLEDQMLISQDDVLIQGSYLSTITNDDDHFLVITEVQSSNFIYLINSNNVDLQLIEKIHTQDEEDTASTTIIVGFSVLLMIMGVGIIYKKGKDKNSVR